MSVLFTFLKFFVVGGMGFGLDLASTWLFKEKMKLQKYVANSFGFFVGIVFRFVMNKFWAFQDE
ncbi:MAG: GtrA family protein, partial [Chitinophagales bacterium]